MNPQCHILENHSNLSLLINAIQTILVANRPATFSSCEIYNRLSPQIRNSLKNIAKNYSNCACAVAESYVGSADAELARNSGATHYKSYYCPILKRNDDAFSA